MQTFTFKVRFSTGSPVEIPIDAATLSDAWILVTSRLATYDRDVDSIYIR
jgi:hypothetical protein